jgi:hypothetical protein
MAVMHLPHFPADRVSVLNGNPAVLNSFHHDLIIEALASNPRPVVFLDGAHCLNPYDFGERNFQRGNPGAHGADRVLTCRAMTPFQWAKMLMDQLHDTLQAHGPSLVVAAHFDLQFNKDDLVDWEQEDYVAASLRYMRRMAHLHKVPIILTLDLAHWTRTHSAPSQILLHTGLPRRSVTWDPRGFTLLDEQGRTLVQPSGRLTTLDAWAPQAEEVELEIRT